MKERDAYFDNLKFILILLVVVGHLIEPFNGEAAMGAIYQFIYSFHMPLFILRPVISPSAFNPQTIRRPAVGTGRAVFHIRDALYPVRLLHARLGSARLHVLLPQLDPVVPVQHDAVENASAVPADAQIPARHLFRDVHHARVLDRCRLLREHFAHAVLPALFLIGYVFKREWLDAIKARSFQLLSIALLAGGFVLLYMLSPILDASWFYGAMPYLEFGLESWYAGFYRAITYAFTVIMGLCVLSLIPRSDTPFTDRG